MKRFKKLLQNHQSRYKEKSEKNKKKQKNKTKTKQKNNKKKNMVQNRFSQKTTNKNMLPSLTQIFTQRSCPVYLPHPGSSHIEECAPNKQVLSKSLKMYSQNP